MNGVSTQQLPLTLTWSECATFENFVPGDNAHLVAFLSDFITQQVSNVTYLYALESGLGRTHLLHAACHAVTKQGGTAAYLSFKQSFSLDILDGMESVSLLCLDDIDQIIGQSLWEEALFNLYHRLQDRRVHLLVTARGAPAEAKWYLPDLQSRFASAVVFQVKPISDEEKITVLQQRAEARGLVLTQEIGQYLLSRFPRDMSQLMNVLNILDKAALSAQRRLTVPFIKAILGKYKCNPDPR